MLTFGDVTIEPGEKKQFTLPVTQSPSGQSLGFPMVVVNGKHEGPKFLVDGGIHGDEYESAEAIRGTWRDLDPAALHGAFVGVPVVNVSAFEVGGRTNSVDGTDMNRIFPGKRDGLLTEQFAYQFFNEVVLKCDMGMDMHSGGLVLANTPAVVYQEIEDEGMRAKSREIAYATGSDLIHKGSAGSGGWLNVAAPMAGIPYVTTEHGGEGRCREVFVQAQREFIDNIMKHYEMIPGEPEAPSERMVVTGGFQTCSTGGLFRTWKELRDPVKEGEVMGTIMDLFGAVVEEAKAPYDGIILAQRTFPTINPGDLTVMVGALE